MCGGGGLLKALLPVLGAIGGTALLPGIGTALGADVGGLATAGGALGGLAGGALGGASGPGLLLDAVGGGIAPNVGDILSGAGDQLSNFGQSTGLSSLFGGTPQAAGSLDDAYSGITGAPSASADTLSGATSAGATAPTGVSGTYLPSSGTGLSGLGGGAAGGGFNPAEVGEASSLPSSTGVGGTFDYGLSGEPTGVASSGAGAGIAGTPPSGIGNTLSSLFNPSSNVATGSFDINGAPTGASSYSIPQQFANAAAPGSTSVPNILSNLFGSGSGASGGSSQLINGLLRTAGSGLLNNPNNKGYNAQMQAGQQVEGDYAPYLASGTAANNTLSALYGENGNGAQAAAQANWQNTPGYQFNLQQGENAVNANAAAMGQTLSGNNQQAIQQYGSGLANQTYNNYLSNLQQQAGQGVQAAGGVATGQAGVANAQAGKGGAGANNQNATTAGILSALFPQNGISLAGNTLTGTNGNNGIMQYLFGS